MSHRKHQIERIEVHAAHACNLTCESCSHFSNSGHRGVVTAQMISEWLAPWSTRLAPARFRIVGGEPTINPELPTIVRLVRRFFPGILRLELVTNGFFLDRHRLLPAALAKCRATVHLSVHHDSAGYAEHVKRALNVLREWGQRYGVPHAVQESFTGWTRRHIGFGPAVLPFHDNNPARSWKNCPARFCRQIFEGKLWKCSPIAYLRLQKAAFPQLSPEWDPYLSYQPLSADCTDEELAAFFARREEACCCMCPGKPTLFEKADPLIPRSSLLAGIKSRPHSPGNAPAQATSE